MAAMLHLVPLLAGAGSHAYVKSIITQWAELQLMGSYWRELVFANCAAAPPPDAGGREKHNRELDLTIEHFHADAKGAGAAHQSVRAQGHEWSVHVQG